MRRVDRVGKVEGAALSFLVVFRVGVIGIETS